MEVPDVEGVLRDVVTEIVCFPVDGAALGAASRHPHGEAAGMMVSSVVRFAESALAVNGASEFPTPDDQGVLKHASFLEVIDESVTGTVDVLALGGHTAIDIAVMVPVVVVDLNEPDITFREPACHEGDIGKASRFSGFLAIELKGAFGFLAQVREFGHAGLHAGCHFILPDAGKGLGVTKFLVGQFIEFIDALDRALTD